MIKKISKSCRARLYSLIVFYKQLFLKSEPLKTDCPLEEILEKYKNKKKIIVFCSGPSASKAEVELESLYLVTNDGYKGTLEKNVEFLLYLNDQFGLNRAFVHNSDFKEEQTFLFFYNDSYLHRSGFDYVKNKVHLLRGENKIFFLNDVKYPIALENYNQLIQFYKERNLPFKIQNSGMFLLLFGFYLAHKLNLPLEIYGLDLGVGGAVHFNTNDIPGKSVLRERVKENVEMYLNYIYSNHFDVKNFSNFYGKI